MTPRAYFRSIANAEAVTWTLLIGGIVARSAGMGGLGVTIGGALHGFVFLSYAASVVIVGLNQRWRAGTIILGVGSAFIPFATIPFDRVSERRGAFDGDWRLTETDHPRDQLWHDRLLRWFLAHPYLLVIAGSASIVATFVILLALGPPGGRE